MVILSRRLLEAFDDAGRNARTREFPVPGTPTLIVYMVQDATLEIVAVLQALRSFRGSGLGRGAEFVFPGLTFVLGKGGGPFFSRREPVGGLADLPDGPGFVARLGLGRRGRAQRSGPQGRDEEREAEAGHGSLPISFGPAPP